MADLQTMVRLFLEDNGEDFDELTVNLDVHFETNEDGQVELKNWEVGNLELPSLEELALKYGTKADDKENNFVSIEKRTKEYGRVEDQLDEIYHDMDAWKTRISEIKTKYPISK